MLLLLFLQQWFFNQNKWALMFKNKMKRTESRMSANAANNHGPLRPVSPSPHLCSGGDVATCPSPFCHTYIHMASWLFNNGIMKSSLYTCQSRYKWVVFMTAKYTVHTILKHNPKHKASFRLRLTKPGNCIISLEGWDSIYVRGLWNE